MTTGDPWYGRMAMTTDEEQELGELNETGFGGRRSASAPDEVEATLASTLDCLDDAINYLRWIVDLTLPYLDGPILEVGAGHGTFTASFAKLGTVHAVEPSQLASGLLSDRYGDDPRVTITHGLVEDLPTGPTFGSAVMINVLEHIEDDAAALREIYARLQPGGHIAIWVPAFRLLYSDFDRQLGHHRRYRRPGLEQVATASGFRVVRSHYVNLPGWFSWLIVARLAGKAPTAGPLVAIFDRFIVPIVRFVESRFVPPFGQSIILFARKPLTVEG